MKGGPLVYGKFAALGVVVGFFSSIFGVGGGIIMIPALVLLFGFGQHAAQGVSLAVMVPTALTGAMRYWHAWDVHLGAAVAICVGSIPAAGLGGKLAQDLPQATLRSMFALFMVAAAVRTMPTGGLRSMSLLLGMLLVAAGVRLMLAR